MRSASSEMKFSEHFSIDLILLVFPQPTNREFSLERWVEWEGSTWREEIF